MLFINRKFDIRRIVAVDKMLALQGAVFRYLLMLLTVGPFSIGPAGSRRRRVLAGAGPGGHGLSKFNHAHLLGIDDLRLPLTDTFAASPIHEHAELRLLVGRLFRFLF